MLNPNGQLQDLAVFPALGQKQKNCTVTSCFLFCPLTVGRHWKQTKSKVLVCISRSPRLLPREFQDYHMSKSPLAKRPGHIPGNTQMQKTGHSQFCDWSFEYPWCGSRVWFHWTSLARHCLQEWNWRARYSTAAELEAARGIPCKCSLAVECNLRCPGCLAKQQTTASPTSSSPAHVSFPSLLGSSWLRFPCMQLKP